MRHHHHQNAVAIWNVNAKMDTQDTLIIQDCFFFRCTFLYIFEFEWCLYDFILKSDIFDRKIPKKATQDVFQVPNVLKDNVEKTNIGMNVDHHAMKISAALPWVTVEPPPELFDH